METLIDFLNHQPLIALLVVLVLGTLLGQLRLGGVGLGVSAVLFVALPLGHLGLRLPETLGSLGLSFFVYAIGLQAGPHFVHHLQRRGRAFLALAGVVLGSAFATALFLGLVVRFDPALLTGVYAGAMTSTPSLAASLEVLGDPTVSVGYGVGYPFGLFALLGFVYLAPRVLGANLQEEVAQAEASERPSPVLLVWFVVENPLVDGKTVSEVTSVLQAQVEFSRIVQNGRVSPVRGDHRIHAGDHVRAVGTEEELKRLELFLGQRTPHFQEPPSTITVVTLVVTAAGVVGKRLCELAWRERYGVNITRLWREELEVVPTGKTTLEFGDRIRVVGDPADCDRITAEIGHQVKQLEETPLFPLVFALLLGLLLGLVALPFPLGGTVRLGIAGGVLMIGLLAGHLGRVGSFTLRIPPATRFFLREMGLILFLADAGIQAGRGFWEVLRNEGALLCLLALIMRTVPLVLGLLFARRVLGWDLASCLGAISGALTCTAGLAVVTKLADSEVPSRAYVVVYPTALLGVTLLAPLLGLLLRALIST